MSNPSEGREWNATAYHSISEPQLSWGKKVLSKLQLRGDELVMDAGCGSGRLTAELLQALPRGQVVGLDLSHNMLATAREHLCVLTKREKEGEVMPGKDARAPQAVPRIKFVVADLQDLPFQSVFNGIFSTAAFHWVRDHARLFRSLFAALRPGGWLCAQCGGGPNLARLRQRMDALSASAKYAQFFGNFRNPWVYNDAEPAAMLLRQAGFIDVETSLEPAVTLLEDQQKYCEFVRTAILRLHLQQIPDASLRDEFVAELAHQASIDDPPFSLDYWRLNLSGKVPQ